MSIVYIIRPAGADQVKIGYSANFAERFRSLQASSPVALEVLRTVPGSREVESWFHGQFADARKHGEWFDFRETMLTSCPPEDAPAPKEPLSKEALRFRQMVMVCLDQLSHLRAGNDQECQILGEAVGVTARRIRAARHGEVRSVWADEYQQILQWIFDRVPDMIIRTPQHAEFLNSIVVEIETEIVAEAEINEVNAECEVLAARIKVAQACLELKKLEMSRKAAVTPVPVRGTPGDRHDETPMGFSAEHSRGLR